MCKYYANHDAAVRMETSCIPGPQARMQRRGVGGGCSRASRPQDRGGGGFFFAHTVI